MNDEAEDPPKRSMEDILEGLTRPYISKVQLDPPWMKEIRERYRKRRRKEQGEEEQ